LAPQARTGSVDDLLRNLPRIIVVLARHAILAAAAVEVPNEPEEYAVTTYTCAPSARASSAPLSTATSAIAESSVPATIGPFGISLTPADLCA